MGADASDNIARTKYLCKNGYDAIRRQVPVHYSIREGRVIAHTTLSETTVDFGSKEIVDFQK